MIYDWQVLKIYTTCKSIPCAEECFLVVDNLIYNNTMMNIPEPTEALYLRDHISKIKGSVKGESLILLLTSSDNI
jgi:hypothetical protein